MVIVGRGPAGAWLASDPGVAAEGSTIGVPVGDVAASVAEGIGVDGVGGGALAQAATARIKNDPIASLASFMLVTPQ